MHMSSTSEREPRVLAPTRPVVAQGNQPFLSTTRLRRPGSTPRIERRGPLPRANYRVRPPRRSPRYGRVQHSRRSEQPPIAVRLVGSPTSNDRLGGQRAGSDMRRTRLHSEVRPRSLGVRGSVSLGACCEAFACGAHRVPQSSTARRRPGSRPRTERRSRSHRR